MFLPLPLPLPLPMGVRRWSPLERVMGVEPTSSAWKAEVLPLNYTRGAPEPGSACLKTKCPVNGSASPVASTTLYRVVSDGGGGRIRTSEG